jgi:outer membrane protein
VFVFALVAVSTASAQAQTLKIGVFDPGRVSEEAADAMQLQADLTAIRQAKQTDLSAKEQVVNEMRQRLQQQALSLSTDKRATMEIEIQRKILGLNSAKDMASQELQLEFAAAEARFNEKLRQVVDQFARDQGFDMILDLNAVAWAAVTVDVTTQIVDQYNLMFPVASAAEATP